MVKVSFHGPVFQAGILLGVMDAAAEESLEYGRNLIASRTPIDTGNLERGWATNLQDKTIYNEVPYSIWVEQGTKRMRGRGMATRSVGEIESYYADSVGRHVMRRLGG